MKSISEATMTEIKREGGKRYWGGGGEGAPIATFFFICVLSRQPSAPHPVKEFLLRPQEVLSHINPFSVGQGIKPDRPERINYYYYSLIKKLHLEWYWNCFAIKKFCQYLGQHTKQAVQIRRFIASEATLVGCRDFCYFK